MNSPFKILRYHEWWHSGESKNEPYTTKAFTPEGGFSTTSQTGGYDTASIINNKTLLNPTPTMPLRMLPTDVASGPNMLPGTLIQAPIEPVAPMGPFNQTAGGGGGGFGGFKKMSDAQQMGVIGGAIGIAQGLMGRKKRRAQQRAAKNEYQTRRREFENLDTSNLSAGFKNSYANMENTYEDLTVNQQQAQFQAQQNQQSQANIMQNLRGAAGGSGIGGLAQALANQSQIANQKASASIGMQESANQRLAAQGAAQVQQMGAQGEMFAQQQRISGAGIARGLQADKTGTLLGMAQADKAAADQAIQESNAALFGGIGSIAGAAAIGGINSLLKPQQPS